MRNSTLIVLLLILLAPPAIAIETRVKDVARIVGHSDYGLSGIGLVVGLAGDGDRNQQYTLQALANVLQRNNIQVPIESVQSKNVAIVAVQGKISSFAQSGSRIDVIISSMGDARSLHGGTLLRTPLMGPNGETAYAIAEGPISVGGFNAGGGGAGGAAIRRNHPVVGQIIKGGRVIRSVPKAELVKTLEGHSFLELELHDPDFSTAARLAQAINDVFSDAAYAHSAAQVRVSIPAGHIERPVGFLARIEPIKFIPDSQAKVLINERTGTIVATDPVKIDSCAISHGNLTISIASPLNVSQPGPLSQGGGTTVTPSTDVSITENGALTSPPSRNADRARSRFLTKLTWREHPRYHRHLSSHEDLWRFKSRNHLPVNRCLL